MGFRSPFGAWGDLAAKVEDRSLPAVDVQPAFPTLTTGAPLDVTTSNALRVSDAFACIRVLADGISTLPLHAYRRTDQGRIPAGDNARISQLLRRPMPGSTRVDLVSQVVTHMQLHGECFVGKYRNRDGEIAQLGLLHPETIQVELRGQRVVYLLDTIKGRTEHGPDDILHVKAMSEDGLRGLSPVTQCRTALGLSSSLLQSAKQFTEEGSRPSGLLTTEHARSTESLQHMQAAWNSRHAGVQNMHKVAVIAGDVKFVPLGFSQDDAQFLEQRELSAREVARIFRVPAWAIDAPTGDSLTYANVVEQNRALVTHSLRPVAVRIETAISNDADLCPGSTYVQFDFDALLRSAPEQRAQAYTAALNPQTGWMRRDEVRELEELPPETAAEVAKGTRVPFGQPQTATEEAAP
jgi:HK97 family phage portal protein